jgi:prolyl-tRNA editing enzyme YbaK/EbsC (Cys-tRNA(Pro) deacylase)
MMNKLSSSAQRVQDALQSLGFTNTVVEHQQPTRTAREAAQAIGCRVEQIVKSLIFRTKDSHRPILVLVSGPNRVNETRLGKLVQEPIERADPDFVDLTTGFAIGGVPPIGLHTKMLTFIDEDLLPYDEIWAAAGTPNAVFKLTPAEMLSMTQGQTVIIK